MAGARAVPRVGASGTLAASGPTTVRVGTIAELIRGDIFCWGQRKVAALLGSLAIVDSFFVEYAVAANGRLREGSKTGDRDGSGGARRPLPNTPPRGGREHDQTTTLDSWPELSDVWQREPRVEGGWPASDPARRPS